MLKTNSKKARANVRRYFEDMDDGYLEERAAFTGDEIRDPLAYAFRCFLDEKSGDIRRAGFPAFYVFRSWAQGLALGGVFLYYYNRPARDDLAAILEETPEEAARYSEYQAEELLTLMIYREMSRAYDREEALKKC